MKRFIFAVLAGIVTGMLVVTLGDMANHAMFPMPPGVDYRNEPAFKLWLQVAPTGMFAMLAATWLVAAYAAGLVAGHFGGARPFRCALIAGAVMMAATVASLFALPHPAWLALPPLLQLPMAWLGARTVRK